MTIGELKRAIDGLGDGLEITLAVPATDGDGDRVAGQRDRFGLVKVAPAIDPDTAEEYAEFTGDDADWVQHGRHG